VNDAHSATKEVDCAVIDAESIEASELLSTQETAVFLKCSIRHLEVLRLRGEGPPFIKVSSKIFRYLRRDLVRWLVERRVAPPSRLIGPSPQRGGLEQFFERVERRAPAATLAGEGSEPAAISSGGREELP